MASIHATTDVASLSERTSQLAQNGFKLIKLLASGAFAEVYKVESTDEKKTLAAKVYYELAWETRIRHARREFNVIGDLVHPNIVEVYDLVIADDIIFTSMELMGGGELLDHIVAGTGLTAQFGQSVMADICNGLIYLHEGKGMVHLDIKPENILLTQDRRAKLADFDAALSEGTYVTVVRGTSECHPHEYLPNTACGYIIRSQADVWAMGLCLFEVLCGAYPWDSPSRADGDYRDYRDHPQTTAPWSRMPQRTLDIFDSIFTEDIDARADAAEVLAYIQSDFLDDALKIQGRDEVTVFDDPGMITPIEDPVVARRRGLAQRAWGAPLNTSSEWTVLVDSQELETHDKYLVICIQPREHGKIGRVVCEERYSRLLALHRMCTALHPQFTPPRFPKKKIFGRRTQEFIQQRATELADYFEECLSIRECMEFYLSTPEFYMIKSDPTADDYLAEDDGADFVVGDGPTFGYGCESLGVSVSNFETSSEATASEIGSITGSMMSLAMTAEIEGSQSDFYISPLDTDAFEQSAIHETSDFDFPDELRDSPKNRYYNILPRWSSRVVLAGVPSGDSSADYINANYINDFDGTPAYIATQGPRPSTVVDFWRMVWQEKTEIIVMVCKLLQDGKEKCARYWPKAVSASTQFGPFMVTFKTSEKCSSYLLQTFEVSVVGNNDVAPRTIQHFWYNTWPDYGVPTTADGRADPIGVLDMIGHVRSLTQHKRGLPTTTPVVVHCSAGIGRTGTFILVDLAMNALERSRSVDLLEVLDMMRQQRMGQVQRTGQYKLAWQAVVTVAQRKIKAGGGGIIYAMSDRMSARLSSKMRRVSLRKGADWNMGRVGDKDTFQLRADAPATPVSANDNNAITDRRDWIEKQVSNKKKKKKEPKSQIFDKADIGKIVAVSGYNCLGVLRFVGKHYEHHTPRVGVELDEPLGKNDGTVSGHKYFECTMLHGLLCIPTKVTLIKQRPPARLAYDIIAEDVGCTVMVDGFGVGKLRYCGQKSTGDQAIGVHCGVEFAKPVGNSTGVVDGVKLFTCKPDHGVLIPIAKVKRLTPTDRDIGKLVTVKGYDCLAVLQFYGAHKEKGHLRCGLELDQPIGNNDGTVNGHEYFSCEKGFGVLCAVKKVTVYHDELTAPKLRGGGEASA